MLTNKSILSAVPDDYVYALKSVLNELAQEHTCARCRATFRGDSVGTLTCAYHPFKVTNQSARLHAYGGPTADAPPTDCQICNASHLHPMAVRCMGARPSPGSASYGARGCTPIDHATDLYEMLAQPYICVPQLLASQFVATDRRGDYADRRNVLLIDRAEHMSLCVRIQMPGTAQVLLRPVKDLYAEVTELFALDDLQRSVRLARRGPNPSSITRIQGSKSGEALEVHRLYNGEADAVVEFMPFLVIARVAQREPLALVDVPELVTYIADEDLV